MHMLSEELQVLIAKANNGCAESARRLFDEYSEPIRRVVRKRMHDRLRTVFDSGDFLQSVWKDFFTSPTTTEFANPKALIGYLAQMARNKVITTVRKQMGTQSRTLLREQSLDDAGGERSGALASNDLTPSQDFADREDWELFLSKQTPVARRVLELLRAGYTHQEISQQLEVSPKYVQRLLNRLSSSEQLS